MSDAPAPRALVVGCTYHDFETNGELLADALREGGWEPTVTTDAGYLRPDRVAAYDAVVDYRTDSTTTDVQREGLLEFVRSGGGYVGVHPAADIRNFYDGPGNDPELEELLGAGYLDHPEKGEVTVELVGDHPITAGLDDYTVYDEPYRFGEFDDGSDVEVLARTRHEAFGDGDDPGTVPAAWVKPYGDGRVFYLASGHTNEAAGHPTVGELIRRGAAWAARVDPESA